MSSRVNTEVLSLKALCSDGNCHVWTLGYCPGQTSFSSQNFCKEETEQHKNHGGFHELFGSFLWRRLLNIKQFYIYVLSEQNEILGKETGFRRDRRREILNIAEDTQIRSVLLWKVRQKKYILACVLPGNVQFLCLIEVDTFGFWILTESVHLLISTVVCLWQVSFKSGAPISLKLWDGLVDISGFLEPLPVLCHFSLQVLVHL